MYTVTRFQLIEYTAYYGKNVISHITEKNNQNRRLEIPKERCWKLEKISFLVMNARWLYSNAIQYVKIPMNDRNNSRYNAKRNNFVDGLILV